MLAVLAVVVGGPGRGAAPAGPGVRASGGVLGDVAFAPALVSAAVTGRISDTAWREQVTGQLAARFGRAAAAGAVVRWSAGEVDPTCWAWSAGCRPLAGRGCC